MAPWPSNSPRWPTSPPPLQTKLQMNPTLIVSWFCTIFALVVISVRMFGRWVRTETLFREDKVMLWSIIPLLIRMGLVHVILIWGTNNINSSSLLLSPTDIYHRSIGSRCVLASRIFYAIYIWLTKLTILEFVQKTISQTWTRIYRIGATFIYSFLGATLVAVIIATLSECQPFHQYWQVVPEVKASCRIGAAQLLTMGICDIVTDVLLIIFPIPLVIMSRTSVVKKISLCMLFLLSVIPLAITAYRMPSTINKHYNQQYRTLLASLEIFAATCVANIIVIGSFLRDKGAKKIKYRAESMIGGDADGGMLSRAATNTVVRSVATQHWGSDEDLVRDMGMSVKPILRHMSVAQDMSGQAQPVAFVKTDHIQEPVSSITKYGPGLVDNGWTFRNSTTNPTTGKGRRRSSAHSSMSSISDKDARPTSPYRDEPSPTDIKSQNSAYKQMDFFDVGGLMENEAGSSEQANVDYTRRASRLYNSVSVSKSGNDFIADIGGLLSAAHNGKGSSPNYNHEDSDLLEMAVVPPKCKGEYSTQLTPESYARRDMSALKELLDESRTREGRATEPKVAQGDRGPDALDLGDAGGLLS